MTADAHSFVPCSRCGGRGVVTLAQAEEDEQADRERMTERGKATLAVLESIVDRPPSGLPKRLGAPEGQTDPTTPEQASRPGGAVLGPSSTSSVLHGEQE